MSLRQIPLVEARRRIAAVNRALKAGHPRAGSKSGKSAVAIAAESLRMPRPTLIHALAIIKRTHNLTPDWSLEKKPAKPAPIAPREAAQEQRLKDEKKALERQLRATQREMAADENLRQALFGLIQTPLVVPRWTFDVKEAGPAGMPILFTSDFQWGERISATELDGINTFNETIAKQRYKLLIEKTIDLAFAHMVNPRYPGIVYLRGGDAISGDIHAELKETNDLQSIPAVQSLVETEAAGLEQLAAKFGRVHVISVPGNHGRTTVKPQSKRFAETNYDTLSAWYLESYFRQDKRISFRTPLSGDALFKIYGWKFLLTHGDRIGSSGGQGFVGPAATISRGMKKLVDYYAQVGETIDVILIGHFHTPMELEYGFVNGSLPGYSEYAKNFRMRPSPPKQWLLFVHPKFGVTARWPILLGHYPKRATQVDDLAVGKKKA